MGTIFPSCLAEHWFSYVSGWSGPDWPPWMLLGSLLLGIAAGPSANCNLWGPVFFLRAARFRVGFFAGSCATPRKKRDLFQATKKWLPSLGKSRKIDDVIEGGLKTVSGSRGVRRVKPVLSRFAAISFETLSRKSQFLTPTIPMLKLSSGGMTLMKRRLWVRTSATDPRTPPLFLRSFGDSTACPKSST